MPNGIQLSSGVLVGQPVPLDAKFGPYNSTADALNDIALGLRYQGLTVGIKSGGSVVEYWFKDGVSDANFVEKTNAANWNTLPNKPSTFEPSSHTHPISQVTNLQTTLDSKSVRLQAAGYSWDQGQYSTDADSFLLSTNTVHRIATYGSTAFVARVPASPQVGDVIEIFLQGAGQTIAIKQNTTVPWITLGTISGSDASVRLVCVQTSNSGIAMWQLSSFAQVSHNHDERYYTEAETDTLLSGKAAITHAHPASAISDSTGSGRTLLTSNLVGARAHLSLFPSFANRAAFPATGDVDRVYTALDTFKTYVWVTALSDYVEISPNIKSDWNATSGDAEILNKPNVLTKTEFGELDVGFSSTKFQGATIVWDTANGWNLMQYAPPVENVPYQIIAACSDESSLLTSGQKLVFTNFLGWECSTFRASVTEAPTGSSLIVHFRRGTNNLAIVTIAAGTTHASSTNSTSIFNGAPDTLNIFVQQVGGTFAGKGLKVYLEGTRPL
jgi:hypothetical protein